MKHEVIMAVTGTHTTISSEEIEYIILDLLPKNLKFNVKSRFSFWKEPSIIILKVFTLLEV